MGEVEQKGASRIMPVYEYECDVCKTIHEERRSVSDRLKEYMCPNGHVTKLVVSSTSFSLKGSTWSSDGYGSKR